MLDVVNEVFSRSGRTKTRRREASWHHLFYGENAFIYGTRNFHITGGPQHDQKRYCRTDQEFKENDPSSTAPKEPCVFSEMKNITLHLCGFSFIYAEIKSNSPLIIIIWFMYCFIFSLQDVQWNILLNWKVMICIAASFGFFCETGGPLTEVCFERPSWPNTLGLENRAENQTEPSLHLSSSLNTPADWEMKMSHGSQLHLTAKG